MDGLQRHLVFDVTIELPSVGQVFAGWYEHHELNPGHVVAVFEYAPSYLATTTSYNLSPAELEFRTGPQLSRVHDYVHGDSSMKHRRPHHFIQDALPGSWGRSVLTAAGYSAHTQLGERVEGFLLAHTPDPGRPGALRLWVGGKPVLNEPLPNTADVPWFDLVKDTANGAWQRNPDLVALLAQGTGPGGTHPTLSIVENGVHRVAKLPQRGVAISAAHEWVALQLARDCGIRVPDNELRVYDGHAVLLVDRFDRLTDGTRLGYASARTLRASLNNAAQSADEDLADLIRVHSQYPEADCRELFRRTVLSIVIGDTGGGMADYDFCHTGGRWALSSLFGLVPLRSGAGARGNDLAELRATAPRFLLSDHDAAEVIEVVLRAVRDSWREHVEHVEQAGLNVNEIAVWERRCG